MKKCLSLILAMVLILSCLSFVSCSNKQTILIYSASEDEVNANLYDALSKQFPDYNIVIEYLGSGTIYSKLLAEGKETSADIIFDFEATYSEAVINQHPDIFTDLSDYDFSEFKEEVLPSHRFFVPECKTDVAIVYNKQVLSEYGLNVPETYDDLLSEKYKGLISMSSPKTSGTGYAFYSTMVANDGLDNTIEYFDKLMSNVKEVTASGSAPLKSVDRSEAAIGFVMLWQAVMYANENSNLGITFLDKPTGYNLYTFSLVNNGNSAAKEVFDYMFNVWNKQHCQKFYPDAIYKDQGPAGISNYPTNIPEVIMPNIYDPEYKQTLLDAWKH